MIDDSTRVSRVSSDAPSRPTDELANATVEIAASPDEVYTALLDPASLGSWFALPGGGTTHAWEVDPVPGGSWHAKGTTPDGSTVELDGVVTRMEPPHTLEWRWYIGPNGDVPSTVRFELEPTWHHGEHGTRLHVTHVTSRPSFTSVTMGGMHADAGYWKAQLRWLAARVVAESPVLVTAAR